MSMTTMPKVPECGQDKNNPSLSGIEGVEINSKGLRILFNEFTHKVSPNLVKETDDKTQQSITPNRQK